MDQEVLLGRLVYLEDLPIVVNRDHKVQLDQLELEANLVLKAPQALVENEVNPAKSVGPENPEREVNVVPLAQLAQLDL